MTPDEAITAVLRAAAREVAHGLAPERASAYDTFVEMNQEQADEAMQAWNYLVANRPRITSTEAARMEKDAYDAILKASVSSMLALAHFPFLDKIDFDIEEIRMKMI